MEIQLSHTYTPAELRTIARAFRIIENRVRDEPAAFTSSERAKELTRLKLSGLASEAFAAIYLDNQHRYIATEVLFTGTIDGSAVYPREVVRSVIQHNAAAVIFAHNHPSGTPEPSNADQVITRKLQEALRLIDVRVLDHLIVGDSVVSMAERGYL